MPEEKDPLLEINKNLKALTEIMISMDNRINTLEKKQLTPTPNIKMEEITGMKPIDKLPVEDPESVLKRFPDRSMDKTLKDSLDYLPIDRPPQQFVQLKEEILGEEFEMTMEEATDRAEYRITITVPENYRPQNEIMAYHSHYEQSRTDYQNELTRRNEKITQQEIETEMKKWDEKNKEINIPPDRRTRSISRVGGIGINQLREWFQAIRKNIQKFQKQPLEKQREPSTS